MWRDIRSNLPIFDGKRIDWNALKAEFAPRVTGLMKTSFVLLVQHMRGRCHDQHIVLTRFNPGISLA